jgi:NDP-sugar pyrophosphorylase family protein
LEPIEGAILAAGRGERLRAHGSDLPKPLVVLNGETLLARQTRLMVEAGANRVVAVVNSETAGLIARDSLGLPPKLEVVVRDTPNSMETLFELGNHLKRERFLAATVDAIAGDGEIARFVRCALETTCGAAPCADGALGVVRWRGDERPLFVEVDDAGAIRKIGCKSAAMVTAGVYFLPKSVFALRAQARAAGFSALRDFLGALINWGVRLHAVELTGVIDIDVPQDLDAARAMLGGQIAPSKPRGPAGSR